MIETRQLSFEDIKPQKRTKYMQILEILGERKMTAREIEKEMNRRGYSKEEVDQILDEARTEEKANKPFYDGWKWYNWLLLVVIILAIIGGVVGLAIWLTW